VISQLAHVAVKSIDVTVDIDCMIISDEQVQNAIRYLRDSGCPYPGDSGCLASDGLSRECIMVGELRDHLMALPDYREDRIAQAKLAYEGTTGPSADDIAKKLIARCLTDALR